MKRTYGQVLGDRLGVNIINRASGGTGVARAAMCLDAILPTTVDILLIEYALNDCRSAGSLSRDGPLVSMERLLLTLRSSRPRTIPVIIYFLSTPHHPCTTVYNKVAKHHGVLEINLASEAESEPEAALSWSRIKWDHYGHPDSTGHQVAGSLLAQKLRNLTIAPWLHLHLAWSATPAAPLLIDPTFERTDAPWHCATCDQEGCRKLRPRAASTGGFMVSTSGSAGTGTF